jgi:hypothetical protein
MVVRLNTGSKCEAKKPDVLVSELYTLCFSTVLIFVPMVLQFQGCVNYNPLGGTTSHVPLSKVQTTCQTTEILKHHLTSLSHWLCSSTRSTTTLCNQPLDNAALLYQYPITSAQLAILHSVSFL